MKKIFLLASVAFTFNAFSQKVNNQLSFQKGQKLEMEVKVNSVISQGMGGDTKVDAIITRSFDVNDVANSNATIEHKIKRVQVNFEAPMMGAQSFDSDKEADMKSEQGKQMEKVLKNKYSMTIDATGRVSAIKTDDDNPNTDSKNADMMANLLGQFASGLEVPKVGDKSDFAILPSKELGKGDNWTDSSQNAKAVYTVSDINDNEIIIDYTETGKTEKKQEAMGMEILISSTEKSTGKITLDRKTGLLKTKTTTINSEGTMEVMGQTVPVTTNTTRTITVKGS